MWSNATSALNGLGVLDKIIKNSKTIVESLLLDHKGETLALLPLKKFERKYKFPTIGITRYKLLSILIEQLGEDHIKLKKKYSHIQRNDKEIVVYIEDGTYYTCDFVIGADGLHSKIREHFFNSSPLRYSGYTSWRGLTKFRHPYIESGKMFEAMGKGVRFGFVPVSDEELYWFATKNSLPSEKHNLNQKQVLIELFDHFPYIVKSALISTNDEDIIRTDVYDRKPLKSMVNEKIILVGDSGHPMTPNYGQGACQALEDSVLLARLFQNNNSQNLSSILSTFDSLRIKRVNKIVNASWEWGKFAQVENKLACKVRNLII